MAFQFGNVFLLFITTCVLARLLFFFFSVHVLRLPHSIPTSVVIGGPLEIKTENLQSWKQQTLFQISWLNQHAVPATLTFHSRNMVKDRWTQSRLTLFI